LFILKIKAFTFVNNCFQNGHNAVIGVFLRAHNKKMASRLSGA
jgi:hypothetical protein